MKWKRDRDPSTREVPAPSQKVVCFFRQWLLITFPALSVCLLTVLAFQQFFVCSCATLCVFVCVVCTHMSMHVCLSVCLCVYTIVCVCMLCMCVASYVCVCVVGVLLECVLYIDGTSCTYLQSGGRSIYESVCARYVLKND